jgi:hypothetical protein
MIFDKVHLLFWILIHNLKLRIRIRTLKKLTALDPDTDRQHCCLVPVRTLVLASRSAGVQSSRPHEARLRPDIFFFFSTTEKREWKYLPFCIQQQIGTVPIAVFIFRHFTLLLFFWDNSQIDRSIVQSSPGAWLSSPTTVKCLSVGSETSGSACCCSGWPSSPASGTAPPAASVVVSS